MVAVIFIIQSVGSKNNTFTKGIPILFFFQMYLLVYPHEEL